MKYGQCRKHHSSPWSDRQSQVGKFFGNFNFRFNFCLKTHQFGRIPSYFWVHATFLVADALCLASVRAFTQCPGRKPPPSPPIPLPSLLMIRCNFGSGWWMLEWILKFRCNFRLAVYNNKKLILGVCIRQQIPSVHWHRHLGSCHSGCFF